jgi:hypothetical protein
MKTFLSSLTLLLAAASTQTQAAPEFFPLYTEEVMKMAL